MIIKAAYWHRATDKLEVEVIADNALRMTESLINLHTDIGKALSEGIFFFYLDDNNIRQFDGEPNKLGEFIWNLYNRNQLR